MSNDWTPDGVRQVLVNSYHCLSQRPTMRGQWIEANAKTNHPEGLQRLYEALAACGPV